MLTVYLENGNQRKVTLLVSFSPLNGKQLMQEVVTKYGLDANNYFLKSNGCLVEADTICSCGDVSFEPRLFGGKGGFGSMLRAIGAQIEKTTNREACRDLSGRRLRDINEEKRLKAWIEKQATRDEEAVERKKKKLEKLLAEPKIEFDRKSFEEQCSAMEKRVEDAVEAGMAAAIKRSADSDAKVNVKKMRKTILDDDLDSDDLSSDESSDESDAVKKTKPATSDSTKEEDNSNSKSSGSSKSSTDQDESSR